jgi:hypothetical protein
MVDPDDAEVVVSDALDILVVDLGVDPADAAGVLVTGGLAELADLGDVRATLTTYRAVLEHLLGELTRLQAATTVKH